MVSVISSFAHFNPQLSASYARWKRQLNFTIYAYRQVIISKR